MKKIFCSLIIMFLLCTLLIPSANAWEYKTLIFKDGSDIVNVEGVNIKLEAPTYIVPTGYNEGRIMVPLRIIGESFGALVDWEPDSKIRLLYAIKLQNGGQQNKEIILQVNNKNVTIISSITEDLSNPENGKIYRDIVSIDVPAQIRNDRTFVPLRFIIEVFFSEVDWDAKTRIATVRGRVGFIPARAIPDSINNLEEQYMQFQIGNRRVTIGGAEFLLENPPFIKNGRAMISADVLIAGPKYMLCRTLEENKFEIINVNNGKFGEKLMLFTNAYEAFFERIYGSNYSERQIFIMDALPEFIGEDNIVPIRFVALAFGLKIKWNSDIQAVTVWFEKNNTI